VYDNIEIMWRKAAVFRDFRGGDISSRGLPSFHPEDGRSNVLQNVDTLPQHYTASPGDFDLR